MNITDGKQQKAVLLYQAGQAIQEIFDTLPDTGDDYAAAMAKLDGYFTPKKNVDFEVFQFRKAMQHSGETTDQFATRLRKLASTCEFANVDKEVKSTIIQNCLSKQLRRVALRDDLSLADLLSKARSQEASEAQAKGIEQLHPLQDAAHHPTTEVNFVHAKQPRPPRKWPTPQVPPEGTLCRYCGYAWPHRSGKCPARGQLCRKCGKPDHFSKVCKSQPTQSQYRPQSRSHVRQICSEQPEDSSTDDEYLYTLGQANTSKNPKVRVRMNDTEVDMFVDTGASTDILDEKTFNKMNDAGNLKLHPPTKLIFAYGADSQLTVVGQITTNIVFEDRSVQSTLHVLQGDHGSLLSYKTACDLGLIDVKVRQVSDHPRLCDKLILQYPNLFNGIGKLTNDEVTLHIDENVYPVAQPARRIPFHMRKMSSTTSSNKASSRR